MVAARKSTETIDADVMRAWEAIVATLVRATRGRFGSNGLKANGKIFAMLAQSTVVVKMPRERVDALVSAGAGERFDPGHGRLMKEWIALRGDTRRWLALAREAHAFVSAE
jgi:TfoX/Sxy family transcriptional regulator of competence genes